MTWTYGHSNGIRIFVKRQSCSKRRRRTFLELSFPCRLTFPEETMKAFLLSVLVIAILLEITVPGYNKFEMFDFQ
jgi:hypothetical protein